MANEVQTVNDNQMVVPGFYSMAAMNQLRKITDVFNKSSLVPETYRGPANWGNCAIVLSMAARMNADPLMMLQNVYVVYGQPAMSSKMMIALFNQCGRFESIHYKETGKKGTDSQGCVAWAKEKSTGEVLEGPEVTIKVAKDEGWFNKSGSKWKTMPDQMLRYRAASWFIRTTAPELSIGFQTTDEVIDVTPQPQTVEATQQNIKHNANAEVFTPVESAPEAPKAIEKSTAKKEAPVKQEAPKQEALAEPVEAKAPVEKPKAAPAGPDF